MVDPAAVRKRLAAIERRDARALGALTRSADDAYEALAAGLSVAELRERRLLEARDASAPSGFSGFRGGRPRCHGCKAFLPAPGAQCPACGFMDGAGYVGVPARTSYLERWR